VPTSGGSARNLTAAYDRGAYLPAPPATPMGPVWSPDGATVTYAVSNEGCIHVVRASTADGSVRPVISGERWVASFTCSTGGERIAFVANAPDEPGDVYVSGGDGASERRLTEVNREWLAEVSLPRVERRRFKSPHGYEIDGWLFLPLEPSGKVPLLLQIHGGPHSFAGSQFQATAFYCYALAASGWACLALNPTGSGSYGKEFAHSIRERWGEHDLPEQLAAADALIEEGIVDGDRLAVTGYSYGGYMTSWTIGHSDRFKAAVVGAPLSNFESFHGSSDIGLWFSPWELRGAIHEQRERYRRLSPVHYLDRCTTPTLIMHGENDDRCPIGQGEEVYAALVAAGKVPVEFVRYPGGPHGFVSTGRPSHRVDYSRRVVDWMEKYVR
jgi:dipeptidyl aminopeptidase/acylaminoacyl peptidase